MSVVWMGTNQVKTIQRSMEKLPYSDSDGGGHGDFADGVDGAVGDYIMTNLSWSPGRGVVSGFRPLLSVEFEVEEVEVFGVAASVAACTASAALENQVLPGSAKMRAK